MSELPSSWAQVPIGSVCVETEQVTPESEVEFTYIDIGSVDRFKKKITAPQRLLGKEAPSRARKRIRAGDTIVSTTRPNLNAVALVDQSLDGQIASTGFEVLRAPGLDPRWLGYLVRTSAFVDAMTSLVQGALYPAVRGKDVRSFVAPIAPDNEQQRIADKLDTVLTRVDAVNTRLARVAPILKRFRQSVLAAATSGRLTEDWRLAQSLKQGTETTLQAICMPDRVITYGVVKLGNETPGGTPCLRTSNVRWLRFELNGMKLIDPNLSAEYGRTVLRGGEVLVNVRGTLGGVAVATDDMVGWNVSREVAVVPVDQALASSAYISLWIASDECQRWLTGVTKGVAYTGINIEDLRTLPLKLPLKEEQFEIVRRVETMFAFANRLEARLQTAQTATERLTPALLAKAFRGELVPQDPNDEPASELLKRLAASAPASTPKRGRSKASTAT